MLENNREDIYKSLLYAQNRLKRHPESWFGLVTAGRCLRALGEKSANQYFVDAIQNFPPINNDARNMIKLACIYRLLGDYKQTNELFESAYEIFQKRIDDNQISENQVILGELIQMCFLAKKYEDLYEYAEKLDKKEKDKTLLPFVLAQMGNAIISKDAKIANDVLLKIEKLIKRFNASVCDGVGPQLWDYYEIVNELIKFHF
ncbi:MAG: hypothetical protein JXA53_01810 [Bacteroidales bacterium]|nr:hypothetical protein [Bacteroidales bacterium]